LAAWKPATSSASVNGRTRITSRPSCSACDGLLGGEHDLALGRARRGADTARQHLELGLGVEGRVQQRVERAGSMVESASSLESSPSSTASTAKRTAACAGRLALRVCSMNSCPSSIVNSVSCMSL
jgi:hypothetical protein